MKECTFRKIQCNAGHYSRVFAADEALPRRCPICNQPYDRRYNRPILCYHDGSVLEEDTDNKNQNESLNIKSKIGQEDVIDSSIVQENPRRGREISQKDSVSITTAPFRRRTVSEVNTVSQNTEQEKVSGKSMVLYTGGYKIEIPNQGGYLGREDLGQDIFLMNPLISRKHTYVRGDRLGNLLVKDADSLNGTYVDDGNGRRRLKPEEMVMLKAGNTLWIANQILAVEEETE